MREIILPLVVIVFIISCWVVNINKLIACDWEKDYRCEIIHGVGLVPIISVGTVWFGVDVEIN